MAIRWGYYEAKERREKFSKLESIHMLRTIARAPQKTFDQLPGAIQERVMARKRAREQKK
jgi:hypothetical protein